MAIVTEESAIALMSAAEDIQTTMVNENWQHRSRPITVTRESDIVDVSKKLVESISYRDSIEKNSWEAVSGRSHSWEVR